jgi:DNA adenine methylase
MSSDDNYIVLLKKLIFIIIYYWFILGLIMHTNVPNITLKPFLKWAGGKTQLLPVISHNYPFELGKSITKYAEPFIGGGAVLFDILSNYQLEEVYISDINADLINTYNAIKHHCEELITLLIHLRDTYLKLTDLEQNIFYYDIRQKYNKITPTSHTTIDILKAVYFIFLNKTCFNGLYRVNRSGEFNVPTGKYKNPSILDIPNLLNIANRLSNVKIVHGNYERCADFVDKKTFVYFDPPYRPISKTSSFTAYSSDVFDDSSQEQLAHFIQKLSNIGAKVLASNSDPKNTDTDDIFFDNLYENFTINRINANRMINRDKNKRGKITELLIMNYHN